MGLLREDNGAIYMSISTIVLLATNLILLVPALYFAPWIYFETKVKTNYANTYAIQNAGTGKDIRVYNVGVEDETGIILYSHNRWECLTWQFILLEDNTYLLKNLATQKTFEPVSPPKEGVGLWQKPLGGSRLQYWKFIKQPDGKYLIQLKGTELYLSATSDEDNSPIVLMPRQESDRQLWRLIKQNPAFK